MTLGAIAEAIANALRDHSKKIDVSKHDHRTVLKAYVGRQLFTITVREEEPDHDEPAI